MKIGKYTIRQKVTSIGRIVSFGYLGFAPLAALAEYTNDPLTWQDVKTSHNIFPSNKVIHDSYVDVSQYNVNTSGGGNATTNTSEIQQAINDAHANNLAVYFPHGTYLVNDTFELYQETKSNGNNDLGEMTFTHVLVGEAGGTRPLIKLASDASGFESPSNPKPLFLYQCWLDGDYPPNEVNEQPADAYNMVFRGIDIDLNGRAGAIGVDMHAAQGSTIQDVEIDATGAYAGIQSLCGSGTIHANIKVIGGKYGVYINANSPMGVLVGVSFENQSTRAIHIGNGCMGPFTIVGFSIKTDSNTYPVFELDQDPWAKDNGHLTLVDGSIEFTGPAGEAIKNKNRSVHLRNVYCKKANKIVNNTAVSGSPDLSGSATGWKSVDDYNYFHVADRQLIDGARDEGEFKTSTTTGEAPPADLVSRHLWDEANFPHIDGNVIVVGPDDGAGDDDSDAIQDAIDLAYSNNTGQAVFLKQGDYNLKRSLVLKENTKLVGVSRNLTRLHCDSSFTGTSSNIKSMITTPSSAQDGADATCLLAWLALHMPEDEHDYVTFLDWTAGRHSMVREVHFMKDLVWGAQTNAIGTKRVKISSSGGGRWYSVFGRAAAHQGEHNEHRLFHIENTLGEPVSIYGLTVEYSESPKYQAEIRNAQNVSIYGLKGETDLGGGDNGGNIQRTRTLGIVNSDNIIVMGLHGKTQLDQNEDRGVIEFDNSTNVEVANAAPSWKSIYGYAIVKDRSGGANAEVNKVVNDSHTYPCALAIVGNPDPIAYTPPVGGGSGGNLVVNHEFEDNPDMNGYSGSGVLGYGSNAFGGTGQSAKLVSGSSWVTIDQIVNDLAPNTDYEISGFLKRVGSNSGGSMFQIIWRDGTTELDTDVVVEHTGPASTWTQYLGEFTSPAGTDNAKVQVVSTGQIGTGVTIWVDELSLASLAPPPSSPLANGEYTLQTTSSTKYAKTNGGGNLSVPADANNNNNVWELEWITGAEYYILKPGTTERIGLPNGDDSDCISKYGPGDDTRIWIFTEVSPGVYEIKNKEYSACYLFAGSADANINGRDDVEGWSNAKWTVTEAP